MIDLGHGQAIDINNRGQILATGSSGPYLWTRADGFRYLDLGNVVGQVVRTSHGIHPGSATPVLWRIRRPGGIANP